jgi:hypothetical protein
MTTTPPTATGTTPAPAIAQPATDFQFPGWVVLDLANGFAAGTANLASYNGVEGIALQVPRAANKPLASLFFPWAAIRRVEWVSETIARQLAGEMREFSDKLVQFYK